MDRLTTVQCLDDPTVLGFIEGTLSPDALAAADAHLDHCADCRELLVGVHRADSAGEPTASIDDAPPQPGASFGRFVLLNPLGAGAMGVVYAAHDPQLDRRVALKLLAADPDDPQIVARLQREARAMAKLSHPNVVAIYDVGLARDTVFIAMELVDAGTLRTWAQGKPWRSVRDVCVQAGHGLNAAHGAGLVHRDYKPDNVFVGSDRTRVGDFGLATGLGGLSETAVSGQDLLLSARTQTGAFAGTPAYMAPELLEGGRPDALSDQYAYCVASFEALCGAHPFPAKTIHALRLLAGRGAEIPTNVAVPRWLLSVLGRGMSLRPQDRFPSMAALLDALQRDKRRRMGIGALGAAAAIAGTGAAVLSLGASSPGPTPCQSATETIGEIWSPQRAADLDAAFNGARPTYGAGVADAVGAAVDDWASAWAAEHTAACRATHVDDAQSGAVLDVRMACLSGQRQELSALVDQLIAEPGRGIDRAMQAVVALPQAEVCADVDTLTRVDDTPSDPRVAEAVAQVRADAAVTRSLLRTGQTQAGSARAKTLLATAQETGHAPVIAEAWLAVALAARSEGAFESASAAANESLSAAQRGHDDRMAARAWLSLLQIANAAGHYEEGAQLARHGAAAVARLGNPLDLEAPLHNGLGIVHDNLGHGTLARTAFERALTLRRAQLGEQSTEVARVLTNLGNLARNERNYDEALSRHQEAMAIDLEVFGDQHPALGRHLHNIARLLLLTGKRDEALTHYKRALALKQAAHGPGHVTVARTHNSLGLLYAADGDATAATESFGRALAIYADLEHPEQGLVHYNLGLQKAAVDDHGAAVQAFARADPWIAENSGPTSRRYIELMLARASAEHARGNASVAHAEYTKALKTATDLGDATLIKTATEGVAKTRPRIERPPEKPRTVALSKPKPKPKPSKTPPKVPPTVPPGGAYAAGPGLDEP